MPGALVKVRSWASEERPGGGSERVENGPRNSGEIRCSHPSHPQPPKLLPVRGGWAGVDVFLARLESEIRHRRDGRPTFPEEPSRPLAPEAPAPRRALGRTEIPRVLSDGGAQCTRAFAYTVM